MQTLSTTVDTGHSNDNDLSSVSPVSSVVER